MYFVGNKSFGELLEAVDYCKARPTTTLTDSRGQVLMKHVRVPFSTFRDIYLARAILMLQTC